MPQATLEKPETISKPVAVRKPRRRLLAIAEFLLFLIVGLLLLEPVLKLAGVADEENYKLDKRIGWTPVPNRLATYRTEGYSHYKINSLGMRDRERTVAKPPNTFRIAVVGCSMTEGKQVPLENTYCSVLEKQLNKEGGPVKYEVLNFAVSAYTLGQEYLRLKYFAMQFKPDLVIFTARPNALLYMGPDLKLGFFNARPVFGVMPDGTLVEDHHFQEHWLASAEGRRHQNNFWLSTYSNLYGLVGKCAYNLAKFKKEKTVELSLLLAPKKQRQQLVANVLMPGVDVRTSTKDMNIALDYLGKVAAAIVREAKGECDKAHCRFLLAYLPSPSQYRDAKEGQIVHRFAKELNVELFDLNPEFESIERVSAKPLYLEIHPSKYGHEMMASHFKAYLERGGFLKLGGQAKSAHSRAVANVN